MNLFVARIHNNTLGTCVPVATVEEGAERIKRYVKEQFNRDLTQEELEIFDNNMEFYNDEDPDNIYTFAIGMLDF